MRAQYPPGARSLSSKVTVAPGDPDVVPAAPNVEPDGTPAVSLDDGADAFRLQFTEVAAVPVPRNARSTM